MSIKEQSNSGGKSEFHFIPILGFLSEHSKWYNYLKIQKDFHISLKVILL